MKEGVCIPHDSSKLEKASKKTSCCGPATADKLQNEIPRASKSLLWAPNGSPVLKEVAAQVSSWWKKVDATDIVLCGALALSGVALCIAIDLHRRSR